MARRGTTAKKGNGTKRMEVLPPGKAKLGVHEALIYVMITTSAVDRRMLDAELQRIGNTVTHFPIFDGYDKDKLIRTAQACGRVVSDADGMRKVLDLIAEALPERLYETAYAMAVEVASADLKVALEEVRFLELLAERLELEPLVTAAIERSATARHQEL